MGKKALWVFLAVVSFSYSQASDKSQEQAIIKTITTEWIELGIYTGDMPRRDVCIMNLNDSAGLHFSVSTLSAPSAHPNFAIADDKKPIDSIVMTTPTQDLLDLQITYVNSKRAHLVLERREGKLEVTLETVKHGYAEKITCVLGY